MTEKQLNAIYRVIDADPVSITTQDAAEIIPADPQTLREACKAGRQGFPVCIVGDTIKIPARPFFEFWGIQYERATPSRETRIEQCARLLERINNEDLERSGAGNQPG